MKKLLMRMFTILLYIVILLGLVDFKIWILFDLRMMCMVAFGTVLLTLSNYKKGMKFDDIKIPASWNAMLTAYLTTFVLLFSRLSSNMDSSLIQDVAMNCRPLLYGLIINILLSSEIQNNQKKTLYEDVIRVNDNTEIINKKLKEFGLTDREIEIAVCIYNRLSNKEIGEKLFISESTVKKHTSNFYKKIHVSNREQLIQFMKQLIE